MVCPYCKIDPVETTPKTICRNCRNYSEAIAAIKAEQEELELFKKFAYLPWKKKGS